MECGVDDAIIWAAAGMGACADDVLCPVPARPSLSGAVCSGSASPFPRLSRADLPAPTGSTASDERAGLTIAAPSPLGTTELAPGLAILFESVFWFTAEPVTEDVGVAGLVAAALASVIVPLTWGASVADAPANVVGALSCAVAGIPVSDPVSTESEEFCLCTGEATLTSGVSARAPIWGPGGESRSPVLLSGAVCSGSLPMIGHSTGSSLLGSTASGPAISDGDVRPRELAGDPAAVAAVALPGDIDCASRFTAVAEPAVCSESIALGEATPCALPPISSEAGHRFAAGMGIANTAAKAFRTPPEPPGKLPVTLVFLPTLLSPSALETRSDEDVTFWRASGRGDSREAVANKD